MKLISKFVGNIFLHFGGLWKLISYKIKLCGHILGQAKLIYSLSSIPLQKCMQARGHFSLFIIHFFEIKLMEVIIILLLLLLSILS